MTDTEAMQSINEIIDGHRRGKSAEACLYEIQDLVDELQGVALSQRESELFLIRALARALERGLSPPLLFPRKTELQRAERALSVLGLTESAKQVRSCM